MTDHPEPPMGGVSVTGRDSSHDAVPAGHTTCSICATVLRPGTVDVRCWTDPRDLTVAVHTHCLRRIGRDELHLPLPGEL